MQFSEPLAKKSLKQLSNLTCSRKKCLSQNQGHLEMVWFGSSYQQKQMTCSNCLLLDEEAVKKICPVGYNVVPLLNFAEKLLKEYKIYGERKTSATWHPTQLKDRRKQLQIEMENFEQRLIASLKGLLMSLEGFIKKVHQKNEQIFSNETFDTIIKMNNKDNFEHLLESIQLLVKRLNYSQITNAVEFDKVEIRNKNMGKLKEKIEEVNEKVLKVLNGLLEDLKKRNENVGKI